MGSIDAAGYQKDSYSEWLTLIEGYIKEEEGDDVDLDPTGPWGQIAIILARLASINDDVQEEVYSVRDPDNATGNGLTKLSAETGTYRQDTTFTQVDNALFKGDEGTIVPVGSKATQSPDFLPPDGLEYTTTGVVSITKTACSQVLLEATANTGGAIIYTITIDSIPYSSIITGIQTQEDAIDDIISQFPSTITGLKIDDNLLSIISDAPMSIIWSGTFTITELWSAGDLIANQAGAITCQPSSLTVILTSVTGWRGITNPTPGTVGQAAESDTNLRIRRKDELIKGKATETAITAALLNIENVSTADSVSNRTDGTVGGQPKKSVENIVAGGLDDDIAQVIYEAQAGGMEWYGRGGHSGTAIDSIDGQEYTILFSRPTAQYVHIRFTRIDNTEQVYPVDGENQIKEATLAYCTNRYQLGDDIIKTELSIPFYEVPGSILTKVEYALTAAPGDTPTWLETDTLTIGPAEYGAFDTARVFILEGP